MQVSGPQLRGVLPSPGCSVHREKNQKKKAILTFLGDTPYNAKFSVPRTQASLKDEMKLCPCAHQGAAATYSVKEFCALVEDSNAADAFYVSDISDLTPHLGLPVSASAPAPPIHSHQGHHMAL